MRRLLLGLVALIALTVAQRAAALIIVEYAFDETNATLSITSPFAASIPPQGTLDGHIQVSYASDSSGKIVEGPATLQMFALSSDLDIATSIPLVGSFTVTGPVSVSLNNPVAAALSGNELAFGGATGSFHGAGTVTCTGAPCSLASLPSGQPFPFEGDRNVTIPTLTVASIHGTITGFNFAGISASLSFDAPETGRTAPEPSVSFLGALGAALVALRRARA